MSSFSGIQRALTGLQAQRQAMDVAGQNIANANTPGYTRQRVELQALAPTGTVSNFGMPRQVGDGVGVVTTARLSDSFLDAKVNRESATNANLGKRAETITSVERLLSEPGDTGLSTKLTAMWNAWSTASNNTSNAGAKSVVLATSQAVIDALATGSAEVSSLWDEQSAQLDTMVMEVNTTSGSIAELNDTISKTIASGGTPNDLLDARDRLVTRLVELTGATATPGERGAVSVHLGGAPLVSGSMSWDVARPTGDSSKNIDHAKAASTSKPPMAGLSLQWKSTDGSRQSLQVVSGEIGATLDALNVALPKASKQFDDVAASLAKTVNAQHAQGSLNGTTAANTPVFKTSNGSMTVTAANISLAVTGPQELALASPNKGMLDGSNGAAIAKIATQKASASGGEAGPDSVWSQTVVTIGTEALAAKTSAATAASSLTRAVADQQSSSGVSLDEETANLLIMQRAYEGAARVLTAVDEALDTLINRTGLVGR